MKYEVYQNRDELWRWRIIDDEGVKIARSHKAWDHPGNCFSEIIRVMQIDTDLNKVTQIFLPRLVHPIYSRE